jgi:hypothetical protein
MTVDVIVQFFQAACAAVHAFVAALTDYSQFKAACAAVRRQPAQRVTNILS